MIKNNVVERKYIISSKFDNVNVIIDCVYNCEQRTTCIELNVVPNLVSNCNNKLSNDLNNDLYSYSTNGVLYEDRYRVRDIHFLYKALKCIFTDYFEYLTSTFDECIGIDIHVHNGKLDILKKMYIHHVLKNTSLLHGKSINITISQTLKIGGKN